MIVVTDRTVLDDQLQETIYQFEHTDGVVGRINREEGEGSKSEKLAAALEGSQPIIIVTIQTFPFVLRAIENSVSLKERCYAIIARFNELFITDHLTEQDLVNYAYTVRDKVRENGKVMSQLANNSTEQALLGDFPKAVDDAILDSSAAHEDQKMQLLSDPKKAAAFARLVFDLLKAAS